MMANQKPPPLEPSLERLLPALQLARPRALRLQRSRERRRIVAATIAGASILVGSAVAAISYLGQPAPPKVKQAFERSNAARSAFQELPGAFPLVNANSAETVAVSGTTIMYGAEGKAGNYCTLLLRSGRPVRAPNVRCEIGVWPLAMQLDYKSVVSERQASAPLILSGRLSRHGHSLTARYPGGLVDRVPIGLRGYFVYEPVLRLQRLAKTNAINLVERDRRGTITDVAVLQPPLVVSASPRFAPLVVTGRAFIAGARYVAVSITRPIAFNGRAWGSVGSVDLVPVKRGRFSWHAPRSLGHNYTLTLSVLDARFAHLVDDVGIG